ncbi:MAG: DUF4062 domain-containing protein [Muribaculaceae bacterium]|nr:DUF4062 domain-containing protein [Muribaculaceae bacterium]
METRDIRVFISSTFNDMKPERDWLVKRTFPELRKIAAERGVTVTEVDLRWGITQSEAEDGMTISICLDEIINSRPFFIGLLGNRYGWTPTRRELGADITGSPYEEIIDDVDNQLSITEIEMQYGVLRNPEQIYASFYIRSGGNDDNPKQTTLKDKIRSQDRYPVADYSSPEELGEQVKEQFVKILDSLYPEEEYNESDAASFAHNAWAKTASRNYLPDSRSLSQIDKYLSESSPENKLLVTGDSGSGKSALMAYVAQREIDADRFHVVAHFAGIGLETTASALAERITKECEKVAGQKEILLIIDDANCISDDKGQTDTSWLSAVPDTALLIVSAATGQDVVEDLKRSIKLELFVNPLLLSQRRKLAEEYFSGYRKHLNSSDLDIISHPSQVTDNTLAYVTLLEEIRCFGSFDMLPEYIKRISAFRHTDEFYNFILEEKEQFYDSGRYHDVVKKILSLIALSADGLTEHEIAEISGLPQWLISQFILGNTYLVRRRNSLITISHSQIVDVVSDRYLSDEEWNESMRTHIIEFFNRDDAEEVRRDIELPYQYWRMDKYFELYDYIIRFEYLSKNINANKYFFLRYWDTLLKISPEIFIVDAYLDSLPSIGKLELPDMPDLGDLGDIFAEFNNATLIKFCHLLISNLLQHNAAERLCNRAIIWLTGIQSHELCNGWFALLAVALSRQNKYANSLRVLANAVRNSREDDDEILNSTAECYLTIAERTKKTELIYRAIDIQRYVLEQRIQNYGKIHAYVATAMSNLSSSLSQIGEYEEARRLGEESTQIYIALNGNVDIDVAINLSNQATHESIHGNAEEALRLSRKSEEIFRKLGGNDNYHLENSYIVAIESLIKLDRNEEASEEIRKFMAFLGRNYTGREKNNELLALGKRAIDNKDYRLAIEVYDNIDDTDDFIMARKDNGKGIAFAMLNMFDESLEAYERAVDLYIDAEKYLDAQQTAAGAASNLSIAAHYELSLEWYEKAFALSDRFKLDKDAKLAISYQNYAVTLYNIGQLDESIAAMVQACDIRRELFGDDDDMLTNEYQPLLDQLLRKKESEDSGGDTDEMDYPEAKRFMQYCDDEALIADFAKANACFKKGAMSQAQRLFGDLVDTLYDTDAPICATAWALRSQAYAYEMDKAEESQEKAVGLYENALYLANNAKDPELLEAVAHDYAEYRWNAGDYMAAIRVYTYLMKAVAEYRGLFDIAFMQCLGNMATAMMKTESPDYDFCIHAGTLLLIMGKGCNETEIYEWGSNIVGKSLAMLEIPNEQYSVNVAESIYKVFSFFISRSWPLAAWVINKLYDSVPPANFSDSDTFKRLLCDAEIKTAFMQDKAFDAIEAAEQFASEHPDAIDQSNLDYLRSTTASLYMHLCLFQEASHSLGRIATESASVLADKSICCFFTKDRDSASAILSAHNEEFKKSYPALFELVRQTSGLPIDTNTVCDNLDDSELLDLMLLAISMQRESHTSEAYSYYRKILEYETDSYITDMTKLFATVSFLQEANLSDEANIYRAQAGEIMENLPPHIARNFDKAIKRL